MSFDPALIEQARREITSAPYGHRTAKAAQWAILFNITPQTIYGIIRDNTRKRKRKGNKKHPEYYDWALNIFTIKKMPPEEAGEISTEDARGLAVKKGINPVESLNVHVNTYNAIGRKNGWNKTNKRRNRTQAERPNECHHFDASTSQILFIARRDARDNSELILKIHRPAKHYKNKPVPVDRLRPWIYGLTDDHSGYHICRYIPALGENSGDSMEFLCWVWAQIGLPAELACDQGMLKKAFASRDWIDRLGVALPDSMPYAKEAHGKIERPWRTLWKKFELLYFADRPDYEKFEISMSELNQELSNYTADKYNQLPHRFERDITRQQAWNKINLHGGIVRIPENALSTVARREKRKIDVTGKLEYPGGPYEVVGLHDAWVWVWEGVFEDKLVVQDQVTGVKYEVKDFKPLVRGEFRAHPETPHEKLVKAAAELPAGGRLYSEKKETPEKVVSMPIRTKEERKIDDPFDVDHYADTAAAWVGFCEITGPVMMEAGERRDVEKLFAEHDLSKDFIRNFALEYRAWVEQRRRAAAGA